MRQFLTIVRQYVAARTLVLTIGVPVCRRSLVGAGNWCACFRRSPWLLVRQFVSACPQALTIVGPVYCC